jgi:hypothetical protein
VELRNERRDFDPMSEGSNRTNINLATDWVLTLSEALRLLKSGNLARYTSSTDNSAAIPIWIPERPARGV